MKRNVVAAAYVLEIVGDLEPKLRGPYKNSDTRDRAAKRLRAKDEEYENGIFALDLGRTEKYAFGRTRPDFWTLHMRPETKTRPKRSMLPANL